MNADGEVLSVHCHRLPHHQTAYAMTIHKSQGSEFSDIVCVLPPRGKSNLTNELLYTAITRAKSSFLLCGDKSTITQAINTSISRSSGLGVRLRQIF